MKSNYFQYLFYTFCLCLVCQFVTAQSQGEKINLPSIIPPSPTVASLMQFEEVPVDNHTGQPDINIPLYSKKLNSELSIPIALKYNTQGIKISNRSGWTGTGWSLEAGGTISRTVRGVADEAKKTSNLQVFKGIYNLTNESVFWNFENANDNDKNEYLWNVGGTKNDRWDSELDLYQYSFLGKTGRFVIKKNGSTLIPVLLSKDQNVKITLNYNSDYVINQFTITDTDGYRYIFSAIETTTSTPYFISYPIPIQGGTEGVAPDPLDSRTITTNNTAWQLTSIRTSNTNDLKPLATFSYTNIEEKYETYLNSTESTLITYGTGQYDDYLSSSNLDSGYNQSVFRPTRSYSKYTVIVQTKKLNKIAFKDDTSLTFSFNASDKHPEYVIYNQTTNQPLSAATGTILRNIQIRNSLNNIQKTFLLDYESVVQAYDNNEPAQSRLWLTQVTESVPGSSIILPYKLEYFKKSELPGFGRGDDWGYNPADKRPSGGIYDLEAFKKGLLTRITYPTGGVKDFNWESHTFSYEGNQLLQKNVTNSNPLNSGSMNHSTNFSVTNASPFPAMSGTFTITHNQNVALHIMISNESQASPNLGISSGRYYYQVRIYKNSSSQPIIVKPTSTSYHNIVLAEGDYKYTIGYIPLETPGSSTFINAFVKFEFNGLKQGGQYNQFLMGGGARIRDITFKENSEGEELRKFRYYYNEPRPTETIPDGMYIISPNPDVPSLKSSGSVDAKIGSLNKEYQISDAGILIRSNGQCDNAGLTYKVKTNEQNMLLTKGGYVGYKFVRVGESGTGYSAYTYDSAQDFPMPQNVFSHPFFPAPDLDYKRGLLRIKKVFSQENQLLEETYNNYDYSEEEVAKSYIINDASCAWKMFYNTYYDYKNMSALNQPAPCNQIGNCGGTAPYSFMQQPLVASWAKLKETIKKEYVYPDNTDDYMETKTSYEYNPVNYQVSKQTNHIKEGNIENKYITQYEYPILNYYTPSLFSGNNEINEINNMRNRNVINKPIATLTYKNSNLLQTTINKFSSFNNISLLKEVETLKVNSGAAEDRLKYNRYDIAGNPLEVQMADGKPVTYIWGHNKTLPIAMIEGVTLSQVEAVLGTYTDTSANYTESNMTNINDMRNTLPNAMVTTLTHDPVRGVTSVTDAKGYKMEYRYDSFLRLEYVLDHENNIISRNNYNYRPQP